MRTQANALDARELTFQRTFDAPRHLVWKAWTDPGHLSAWWGPDGFKTSVRRMELMAGGTFELTMLGPDGRSWPCRGIYREIREPERLVLAGEAPDGHACGGGLPPRAIVTITFQESGRKTTVTVHTLLQSAADLEAAVANGYREGWAATLDHLAQHLSNGT